MGIKSLRKLQIGKETDKGDPVPATTLWRGMGGLVDEQELQFVEEDIGVLSQPDSAYIPRLLAGVNLEEVDCTFEQLPYILTAGVKKVEAGTADGAGSGKIYQYDMPTTVANDISTFTVEGGDDAGCEKVSYCFVSEFTLSGAAGEAVKMGATFQGRQAAPSSFTGSIGVPPTEVALFNLGKFYIDNAGSPFGDTPALQSLLSFELNITTGWIPRWTCDGQHYFVFARSTRPEVTLSLTMEHDATAVAEKAKMRAIGGTLRKVRLNFEGSTLTTPGTFTKKTIRLDLCGKYRNLPSMEDEDGDNVLTFELVGIYSGSEAFYGQFKVVNQLATLP